MLVDVVRHARGREIRPRDPARREVVGVGVDDADPPPTGPPEELHAAEDRHALTCEEPDSTREERDEVDVEARAEVELGRALEEERPFLRIEERESREIDLDRV